MIYCISITKEDNKNTHYMNSVMGIGENLCFLHEGRLKWSGHKDQVLTSTNQNLQSFIFASPFLQRLQRAALGAI